MEKEDYCGLICRDFFLFHWRGLMIIFTPLVLLPVPILMKCIESNLVYVVLIMLVYWLFELLPPGITGCIPIVMFPCLGIMNSGLTCQCYMSDALYVFLGGMIVGLAFEHSGLHKRMALIILDMFGVKPPRLLLGIIIFTFLFSTVLNNVAVTIMMCPIVAAAMSELETQGICNYFNEPGPNEVASKYAKKEDTDPPKYPSSVTIGMYLGVAYAATIGGTLTLHGTVTNLAFSQFATHILESKKKSTNFDAEYFEKTTKYISTSSIFLFNVIMMIIEALIIYLCLGIYHMGLFKSGDNKPYAVKDGVHDEIKQKIKDLGLPNSHEVQVCIAFILMFVLLYTREVTPEIGWGKHVQDGIAWDSCAVIFVVFLLFIVPANYSFFNYCFSRGHFPTRQIPSLVTWKVVHSYVHWGTILLLGGAFAVGRAIEKTMQSKSFVENYSDFFEALSTSAMIIIGILIATALTQISSNVTAANIMIYYLRDMATLHHISPVDLLVPGGIACSIAFLLPVSTPPNNIVHHYAHIKTSKMFISGILPTITLLLLLILFSLFWYGLVFGNVESIPPPPPPSPITTTTSSITAAPP